jgi:predicted acylesterase/phospholipase RssA
MRALVLSSGGSRGYYHIGALQYLYNRTNAQHDIICGTSIGALLGAYLAQYKKGQEDFAINRLWMLFCQLRTEDVYVKWRPWGVFQTLFSKRSLYNNKPMRELVDTHIDPLKILDTGRKLRIGVTLYQAIHVGTRSFSNYKIYTEQDPDLRSVIKASSALAPFFEPVRLIEGLGADGGVQNITPIKAAIAAGATSIDVLICYPTALAYPLHPKGPTVITDLVYNVDLMMNRLTWLDVERTQEINELVRAGLSGKREVKLNIIHPLEDLNVNSLEFSPTIAKRLRQQGWDDTKLVLE